MPRPKPQAALSKAPVSSHPVAPPAPALVADVASPAVLTPTPDALANTVMFSVRISRELRTQVRRHSVDAEESMQAITEAALRAYLDVRRS